MRVSAELIGILSVGAALCGLIISVGWMARSAMHDMRKEMRGDLRALDARVGSVERAVDARVGSVERGLARIQGLLEGVGLPNRADAPQAMPGD